MAAIAALATLGLLLAPRVPPRCRAAVMTEHSALEQNLALCAADDGGWSRWASAHGVVAPKLAVRATLPEERGKGGFFAAEDIAELEVVARIPRALVLSPSAEAMSAAAEACMPAGRVEAGQLPPQWAAELTAEALLRSSALSSRPGVCPDGITWQHGGGWATDGADLGGEDVRWGQRDVTGSLLATGSDNDANIYAKFRFPCHPVVHRAGVGLAALTGVTSSQAAIDALVLRGTCYRAMLEQMLPLVHEPTGRWGRGSVRERRAWDVADTLSRVLARATALHLDSDPDAAPTSAVAPLHERLAHCGSRGENTRLVGRDPHAGSSAGGAEADVLLVATRAIPRGEPLTRDYNLAPRLPGDPTEGALRLLLQFGLPPAAWRE
jgi:hypothetical protein